MGKVVITTSSFLIYPRTMHPVPSGQDTWQGGTPRPLSDFESMRMDGLVREASLSSNSGFWNHGAFSDPCPQ